MLECSKKNNKIVFETIPYNFHIRKLSRGMKDTKMTKIKFLRDESYNMWDKNALDGISSILDITEEKITKLEDITIETVQNEIQREKRM